MVRKRRGVVGRQGDWGFRGGATPSSRRHEGLTSNFSTGWMTYSGDDLGSG